MGVGVDWGMVVGGDRELDMYNVTMYMQLARGMLHRQLRSGRGQKCG